MEEAVYLKLLQGYGLNVFEISCMTLFSHCINFKDKLCLRFEDALVVSYIINKTLDKLSWYDLTCFQFYLCSNLPSFVEKSFVMHLKSLIQIFLFHSRANLLLK